MPSLAPGTRRFRMLRAGARKVMLWFHWMTTLERQICDMQPAS